MEVFYSSFILHTVEINGAHHQFGYLYPSATDGTGVRQVVSAIVFTGCRSRQRYGGVCK